MITIDELADHINDSGEVTDTFKQTANRKFIAEVHAVLKEGGIWGWPDACETYRKKGDGFELVDTQQP